MKLLKQIIAESAIEVVEDSGAVGAGSIAAAYLPLFSKIVKRTKPSKNGKIAITDSPYAKTGNKLNLSTAFASRLVEELNQAEDPAVVKQAAVDTQDTIARLKALDTKNTIDARDVVIFGLEDGNGGVVRVSIKPDQAKDFEQSLQSIINDGENEGDTPEIAEILFSMRDHFDIINVEWPEVEEDEEEELPLDAGAEQDGDMPEGDPQMDIPPEEDTAQVQSLLGQVIDMMKADAAARHADAKAREAEAKNVQASAIVKQSMTRVGQEEQFLDMEAAEKTKREEQREIKRLANLAKYKRDIEREDGTSDQNKIDQDLNQQFDQSVDQLDSEENEEVVRYGKSTPLNIRSVAKTPILTLHPNMEKQQTGRPKAAARDIASFILTRVK